MTSLNTGSVTMTIISSESDLSESDESEMNPLMKPTLNPNLKPNWCNHSNRKGDGCEDTQTDNHVDHPAVHLNNSNVDRQLLTIKQRRHALLIKLICISAVCMLQSIGLTFWYVESMLINIHDYSDQTTTLICFYGSMAIACIIASSIVRLLGVKWTIFTGCIGSGLFICAKFVPEIYLLIPGALLGGFLQGPFLIASGIYINILASQFTLIGNGQLSSTLYGFSAFYNLWHLSAPIWVTFFGSVIVPPTVSTTPDSGNNGTIHTEQIACGLKYSWEENRLAGSGEQTHLSYTYYRTQALLGTFLVASFAAAVLTWAMVDSVPDYQGAVENFRSNMRSWIRKCSDHLSETVRQLVDMNTLLLLPLFIYIGMQQIFGYHVFLQVFVRCEFTLNTSFCVLLVMTASTLVFSVPIGFLAKWMGRVKVIIVGCLLQMAVLIILFYWRHPPVSVYYMSAVLWGIADATLQCIVLAHTSLLFERSLVGALSNQRLFQVAGMIIVLLLTWTNISTEIILMVCVLQLFLSGATYISLEIRLRLQEQENRSRTQEQYLLPDTATWLPQLDPLHVKKTSTSALADDKHNYAASYDVIST